MKNENLYKNKTKKSLFFINDSSITNGSKRDLPINHWKNLEKTNILKGEAESLVHFLILFFSARTC